MGKFMLKNVRCMYPELAAPKTFPGQPDEQAKYSIQLLLSKADKGQLAALKAFIKDEIDNSKVNAGLKKQILKTALDSDAYNDFALIKDGDARNARRVDEDKEAVDGYEGNYVVTAKRSQKIGPPLVVGPDAKAIDAGQIAGEIVSGYYVNAQISAYVYTAPKAGVTLSLDAVQLVKKGERFGQSNPFGEVEQTDEDTDGGAFDGSDE